MELLDICRTRDVIASFFIEIKRGIQIVAEK